MNVLLVVGCAGGIDASVVREQCEVEAGGLLGDIEDGHGGTAYASGERGVCTGLKNLSNFNCLPP